jgi:NADPH:quinone reductase-like Zn-dependent oxidoreductase
MCFDISTNPLQRTSMTPVTESPTAPAVPTTMRAALCHRYGPPDTVTIEHVPTPVPKADQVLVAVRATTVSVGDARIRALRMPGGMRLLGRLAMGLRGPRSSILGTEISGDVVAVGSSVSTYRVGDSVFASTGMSMGGHAEYRALPSNGTLAARPATCTHEQAASLCFGGTTALEFLRRTKLRADDRLLVFGASGTVGLATLQLARIEGAHITAVCSAANHPLVTKYGADEAIDYITAGGLAGVAAQLVAAGREFDVIIDCVGELRWRQMRPLVAKGGRVGLVVAGLGAILAAPFRSIGSRSVSGSPIKVRTADLQTLAERVEQGQFEPVIDRVYRLEAHRYVDTGHKRGSVAITVTP